MPVRTLRTTALYHKREETLIEISLIAFFQPFRRRRHLKVLPFRSWGYIKTKGLQDTQLLSFLFPIFNLCVEMLHREYACVPLVLGRFNATGLWGTTQGQVDLECSQPTTYYHSSSPSLIYVWRYCKVCACVSLVLGGFSTTGPEGNAREQVNLNCNQPTTYYHSSLLRVSLSFVLRYCQESLHVLCWCWEGLLHGVCWYVTLAIESV